MALTHVSRMCSSRDFSFAGGLPKRKWEVGAIVSELEGNGWAREECRWVGFTFDERGFGFVDGHGGFEGRRRTVGGVLRRDRHVASEAVAAGCEPSPTGCLVYPRDVLTTPESPQRLAR